MDGYVTIGTKLDTKSFDAQIAKVEKELADLERYADETGVPEEFRRSKKEAQELTVEIEKTKNKLIKLREQQAKLGKEGIKEASAGMLSISNSTSKVLNKVAKWGLAIFGIRSAYMLIRQSMSILSQYNEGLSNQITNIQYSLASALEPVITRIVNLIYTLMQYVNYLTNAWFGFSLFSDKAAKSTGATAKNAQKIKKSLAGFDEINTVSSSSGGDSGSSGGGYTPTGIGSIEGNVPSWLIWIKDNGAVIASIIAGIGAALVVLKLSKVAEGLGLIEKGISGIKALGIGVIIAGIILLVKDIIEFLKDPTWEQFGKIVTDIGIVLAGIALVVGSIPLAIAAAIAIIVGLVITNWDKIKGTLLGALTFIYEKIIKPIGQTFFELGNYIFNKMTAPIKLIIEAFKGLYTAIKNIWNNIVSLFSKVGKKVADVIGNGFKSVINSVLSSLENKLNTFVNAINGAIKAINKIPGVNLSKMEKFSLPRLAVGGIVNNPGLGVPIGGAIAGEAGREGVIPLTNSQAMQELGQAIGKYVNIENAISVNMDSRRINRILASSNNRANFANNR